MLFSHYRRFEKRTKKLKRKCWLRFPQICVFFNDFFMPILAKIVDEFLSVYAQLISVISKPNWILFKSKYQSSFKYWGEILWKKKWNTKLYHAYSVSQQLWRDAKHFFIQLVYKIKKMKNCRNECIINQNKWLNRINKQTNKNKHCTGNVRHRHRHRNHLNNIISVYQNEIFHEVVKRLAE